MTERRGESGSGGGSTTVSHPLRTVAPMNTSTQRPQDRLLPSSNPAPDGVEEIAAWLDEVIPVIAALRDRTAPASEGQRVWMADQAERAEQAITHLDCATFDAEAQDHLCDELHWLHTRATALVEASRVLVLGDRHEAA